MWLALASLILKSLIPYLLNRAFGGGEISLTERDQAIRTAEKSLEIVDKARAARDAAHADFDKRGGVPDDDDPNLRD